MYSKPVYGAVLNFMITEELRDGKNWYSQADWITFREMLGEVNRKLGTNMIYWSEFSYLRLEGAEEILVEYMDRFESEGIRSEIAFQVCSNPKTKNELSPLDAYLMLRKSKLYGFHCDFAEQFVTTNCYDNAILRQKPKKRKYELLDILSNPLDAALLPLTARMVASWKMPEMEPILWKYADDEYLESLDFGLSDEEKIVFQKQIDGHKRSIRFLGYQGLKYYPSEKVDELYQKLLLSEDRAYRDCAKKCMRYLDRQKQRLEKKAQSKKVES